MTSPLVLPFPRRSAHGVCLCIELTLRSVSRAGDSVGRCEVVVFSPEHEGALSQMPISRVRTEVRSSPDVRRTNPIMRLMVDRPTDVWRAFTLKFRPAWTVNNIVGQHILYAMHHAGPAGAIAYLQALK